MIPFFTFNIHTYMWINIISLRPIISNLNIAWGSFHNSTWAEWSSYFHSNFEWPILVQCHYFSFLSNTRFLSMYIVKTNQSSQYRLIRFPFILFLKSIIKQLLMSKYSYKQVKEFRHPMKTICNCIIPLIIFVLLLQLAATCLKTDLKWNA